MQNNGTLCKFLGVSKGGLCPTFASSQRKQNVSFGVSVYAGSVNLFYDFADIKRLG